jgi:hypothetical protein
MAQKLQPRDIEALFSELREIKDPRLRDAVAEIWCETAAEMKWDTLEEIPKNTEEEKGRSLIGHIKGVIAMALAICETAKSLHGKEYDKDAMIAASVLHDVSKLVRAGLRKAKDREHTARRPPEQPWKERAARRLRGAQDAQQRLVSGTREPGHHSYACQRRARKDLGSGCAVLRRLRG